ncbi:MAG: putative Zn-dependent protease [Pseudoalteromonas tetraodonis]|jgi:predicted Zn-dependent protease
MLPMNRTLALAKVVAALLVLLGWQIPSASAVDLAPELETQLQSTLKQAPLGIDDWPLYQATLLKHEALEPLLERLDDLIDADDEDFAALWLAASLHWRYGNLDDARELFEQAAASNDHPLVLFRVGQLFDAAGKPDEAAEQFLKVLESKPDEELSERVRLRLALLKTTGAKLEKFETDLAAFAADRDPAFQNRAALILALADKPKQALELYNPAEQGNERFKQQIRIAEWAMAANDMPKAQEAAWQALMSAKLKRDRRYSLTVLAESYRRANSLEQLIERFAATPELPEEARDAWIDLLRERGDSEEALALFEKAKTAALADGEKAFTADMRRELLEICREAGRDDLLVENLGKMIVEEPRRLEWRSGLCRFYLERGERNMGLAVWDDYRAEATTGSLLAAAGATMDLGLDQLATAFAEDVVKSGTDKEKLGALQFMFDLNKVRGNQDGQIAVLARMDEIAAPDASERATIAEAWEQVGRQDKAAEILEKLRTARGPNNFSSDLETRLAWLYSEVGEEEKAYDSWKSVWLRIDSPGRLRYIEDRLMATASRLGKLADIAIELEEKLADGKADKRDSGLLVRLYTKVGDPVSASEIVQEFMRQSGGSEIAMLEEQARIYVMCNDYYHYEKTIRELMKLDPEGMPEYFTQLAMSALERGRNDQAQAILTEMRDLDHNPASAEFEAGVLKIAGMHNEAAAAYWRGVAENPNRIDTYLLLGQAMQTLGKGKQALGIFQYLVENADKDDLFTIAIDGLLNMNNPRMGSKLEPQTMQWARRAILERLAGKDDKLYLYQLLADMSEELRDQPMRMRALAETLPIAGERRTSQLRELMELARVGLGGSGVPRSDAKLKAKQQMLNYGRRLIGIGEAIPPQVYLDLGASFLDDGDVRNASATFDKANENSDYGGYQRKISSTFEGKGYFKSALRGYENLLIGEFSDVGLVLKVGELKEQLGRGDEAATAYRRALDLLLDGQSLFSVKKENTGSSQSYAYSRNIDDFDKYFDRALIGFLATAGSGEGYANLVKDYGEALAADLKRASAERGDVGGIDEKKLSLANLPRIARRSVLLRRVTLANGDLENASKLAETLLRSLPNEESLLATICNEWNSWGYKRRARDLAEAFQKNPGYAQAVKSLGGEPGSSGINKILQRILAGDDQGARVLLRDLDALLAGSRGSADFNTLFAAARYLKDSAVIEQLATYMINKAPKGTKLQASVDMLVRSFPLIEQAARDRLSAYVGDVLGQQDDLGRSAYYYLGRLKQFTGKSFTVPIETIRPQVEQMLARGSYYVRQIAPMMSSLGKEDYQTLLRELYRDAKSSDRAGIVFSLVAQYPHKMDAALERNFLELAEEIASGATPDLFKVYQSNSRNYYSNYTKTGSPNLGFQAKMLELIAAEQPEETQPAWLAAQAQAWQSAGETERALEIAKREFSNAVEKEAQFDSVLLRTFLSKNPDTFLSILDEQQAEAGPDSVDFQKKRLLLVRKTGDQERILGALRQACERQPKELSFLLELKTQLEAMGRPYEAIKALEAVAKLEPQKDQHRAELERAWQKLAQPVQAARYKIKVEIKDSTPTSQTTTQPKAPGPAPKVVTATKLGAAGRSANEQVDESKDPVKSDEAQEKMIEPASVQLVKKHYDANQPDEAQVAFRRLWRQFPNLGNSSRFYTNRALDGRIFIWPTGKPNSPPSRTPSSVTQAPSRGGLEAFLNRKPSSKLPSSMRGQNPDQPKPVSLFEAVGTEEFAASEMDHWLLTLTTQQYQGQAFEDMLVALATKRVETDGVDQVITKYLDAEKKGELSLLDQHFLLAVLEQYPDAGGEAAASYLKLQVDTLDPADQWKSLRLARCLSKRGNEEMALPLFRWSGAQVSFTGRYNYYQNNLTANRLVEEIRKHLEGDVRLRALDTVLGLMTPARNDANSRSQFHSFVLSTWQRELQAPEVYQRCRQICEQVLVDHQTEQTGNRATLELATLFLASGGNSERALDGLELVMLPIEISTSSSYSTRRVIYSSTGATYVTNSRGASFSRNSQLSDYLLQLWLPEDMQAWTNSDQWLAGIVKRVSQWTSDGRFPPADAAKLLSIVAFRQHQNGSPDAVATTLNELQKLTLPVSNDILWISDAARMTGNLDIAIDLELALLDHQRLPIARVADLMAEVAEQRDPVVAMEIAEKAAGYTWEREFVETMAGIATAAGDAERAAVWQDRHLQMLVLERSPQRLGFVVGSGKASKLYQYSDLQRELILPDYIDGQAVEIRFDLQKRLATATASGEPIEIDVVDSEQWRKANPEGEVYLLSALERGANRLVEFEAEGWRFATTADSSEWLGQEFDDSNWKQGKAPLGFGKSDLATELASPTADFKQHQPSYFRRNIEIKELENIAKLVGRIRCADGAIVYWNGEEIHRRNMPAGDIDPTTTATKTATGTESATFLIPAAKANRGTNLLAIAVHRHKADGKILCFDLDLTAIAKEPKE